VDSLNSNPDTTMPAKTPSKFPAAFRRDALLRGRRVLPALAAVAALQGCVAVGGTTRSDSPTLGKQLIDLKAAFDSGAINETEYQTAKQQLLNKG
jgi:hypothetical protein